MKIKASIYNILIAYLLPIILLSCLFVPAVIGAYISYVELNIALDPLLLMIIVTLGVMICGLSGMMVLGIIRRERGILILTDEGFYCPYLLDASNFIPWKKVGGIDILVGKFRGLITNHIEIRIDHSVKLKRKRGSLNALISNFEKQKLYQPLIFPQLTLAELDILEIYSLLDFYHRKGFGIKPDIKADDERRGVVLFGKLGSQRKLYYETCFSWYYHGITCLLLFFTMWLIFYLVLENANYLISLVYGAISSLIVIVFLEQDQKIGRFVAHRLNPLAIDFDRDGIYQLNKTKFKEQVLWKDIESIKTTLTRIGTQLRPNLIIKLKSPQNKNENFQIRNELLDTSIYELNEILNGYWRKGR